MDSIDDRISLLLNWASSHNALLHPSAQIYDDPDTGLSFRVNPSSTSSIPPYEPIVSLPKETQRCGAPPSSLYDTKLGEVNQGCDCDISANRH